MANKLASFMSGAQLVIYIGGKKVNIPVPDHEGYYLRGDAEVKGGPPDGSGGLSA